MEKVYVVLGYYGQYDDVYTKIEKVYANKEDAEKWVEIANEWLDKYSKYDEFYQDLIATLDNAFEKKYPNIWDNNNIDLAESKFKEIYGKSYEEVWEDYWDSNINEKFIEWVRTYSPCKYSDEELINIKLYYDKNYAYNMPAYIIEEHNIE